MLLKISRKTPLPEKRFELYQAFVETLLRDIPEEYRRAGVQLEHGHFRVPGAARCRKAVAALAFRLQQRTTGSRTVMAPAGKILRWLPNWVSEENRKPFLKWLVDRTGLLVASSDGLVGFAHLSFQEYLAATFLRDRCSDRQRMADFLRKAVKSTTWWETVLLWAALLKDGVSSLVPAFLKALLTPPVSSSALALGGCIFADNIGSRDRFREWCDDWARQLAEEWFDEADYCANAWRACRQETRRQILRDSFKKAAASTWWLAWLRLEQWQKRAGLEGDGTLPMPSLLSSRCALEQILNPNEMPGREMLAVGRGSLLTNPLWPHPEGGHLHWLRLWPGPRWLSACRFQTLANLPDCQYFWSETQKWHVFSQQVVRQFPWDNRQEKLACDLAHYLARELARYEAPNWLPDWAPDLRHDWARDLGRDWARDWARDRSRDWARDWAHECANLRPRNFASYMATDLARDLADYLARDWSCGLGRQWARDWARQWMDIHTGYDWARDLGFEHSSDEIRFLWAMIDEHSFGRMNPRSLIAHKRPNSVDPLAELFHRAGRVSLGLEPFGLRFSEALSQAKKEDPLWPALARWIARQAEKGDQALLEECARNAERYPEPLSWGLQFLVCGDVMLDDRKVITLDEICESVGAPPLPLIEPMPDELDIDWHKAH
jgi:hypothetical protein